MINFNDLPSEIKSKIFKINYDKDQNEKLIKKNKDKYDIVISQLEEVIDELPFYFDMTSYTDGDEWDDEEECISIFIVAYLEDISYLIE